MEIKKIVYIEPSTGKPWKGVGRYENTKIEIVPDGDCYIIRLGKFCDNAEAPAVKHECLRGKVRRTTFKLTASSMIAMFGAYIELLEKMAEWERKNSSAKQG